MTDNHQNNESDLTTAEAAARMGLTTGAVRDLINSGQLPKAKKDGRIWRIPQSDVDTWLQYQALDQPTTAITRWKQIKNHPYVFWPSLFVGGIVTLGLFLFALISAGADMGPFQNRLYETGIVHRFAPRREEEILIVIATFHSGQGNHQSDIQDKLRTAIEEQATKLNIQNLRVEIDPSVLLSTEHQQAEELGQYHNATVIIWGEDTDFEVKTSFLNISAPNLSLSKTTIHELERTSLSAPAEYVQFVNKELSPNITFLAQYAIGTANLLIGDNTTATIVLEDASEQVSSSLAPEILSNLDSLWFALAFAYHSQEMLDQALLNYNRAIELNPRYARAYTNRGVTYEKMGEIDQAIADYDQAIDLDPQDYKAYTNRGFIYTNQEELSQANVDFSKAIDLNPEYSEAYFGRGLAYHLRGELTLAIADYDQAIVHNPQYTNAYANRGVVYFLLGDMNRAIANYDRAINLDPKDSKAYDGRSAVYISQGDLNLALEDLNKAIELDPKDIVAYINRGTIYELQGQLAPAIAEYDRAIEVDPQLPAAYYNRGIAFAKQGELNNAIADLQFYLDNSPNAPNLQEVEAFIAELKAAQHEP